MTINMERENILSLQQEELINKISVLTEKIELNSDMRDRVLQLAPKLQLLDIMKQYNFSIPENWENTRKQLKQELSEDEDGSKMLTVMLSFAVKIHEFYLQTGISEEIYIETMKCFKRFVSEYIVSYGKTGFDRDFWVVRQISGKLFRIGELEYELISWEEEKSIGLHIPSDAIMHLPELSASVKQARSFIYKFFPEFSDVKIICESWLLSKELKKLLSPQSNIIAFQELFDITAFYPEQRDYLEWVYQIGEKQQDSIRTEELPEKTSLQRNMKRFLMENGQVGVAKGVLREERLF